MLVPTLAPTADVATGRRTLAQIQICALGCCCGRTDRDKPAVPVDALKAAWKANALMKTVQLTFTGCLGPCDVVNVVQVQTADESLWLGRLVDPGHFMLLAEWAAAVKAADRLVPLPPALLPFRFERFRAPAVAPASAA